MLIKSTLIASLALAGVTLYLAFSPHEPEGMSRLVFPPFADDAQALMASSSDNEEAARAIVSSIVDAVGACPREHKLVATFGDGSTTYIVIPPYGEMTQNMGGDITIFEREMMHVVRGALEMGAVRFQVLDIAPGDSGIQV